MKLNGNFACNCFAKTFPCDHCEAAEFSCAVGSDGSGAANGANRRALGRRVWISLWVEWNERSGDQILDDGPTELAKLLETTGVVKGELVVVETEEAQERDVEIADMGFAFDGCHAEFVGGADGVASIAAATGEPDGHGVGVVVATIGSAAAHAVVGCASEFAAPDDERAVQEAALFEVGDKCGDGLVHATHEVAVGALDVVMAVPRPVVELYESHAFFDELAGQQAFAAEGIGGVIADTVELLGLRVFFGEVERFGHLHLHAKRELVVVHARGEFVVAWMLCGMRTVELG